MSEGKPLIIKKVIKKGHGGHHGGSWKVAYADFVTAMMAFFLVMWLLAVSSQEGRDGLADYFNNLTLSEAIFNNGLPKNFDGGGSSVLEGGCFSPKPTGTEADEPQESGGKVEVPAEPAELEHLPAGQEGGEGGEQTGSQDFEGQQEPGPYRPTQVEVAKSRLSHELLRAAAADLADISDSLQVEIMPEGLRIQVVDKEGRPMFSSGGANPSPEARRILKVIGEKLAQVSNKVAIEGHTDATGFKGGKYGNWELSTGRAVAARMLLEENGLDQERLLMVAGLAATQPLDRENPADPINRRISIMVYDQPEEEMTTQPPPARQPGPVSEKRPEVILPKSAPEPAPVPPDGSPPPPSAAPTLDELESNILDDTLSGIRSRP